MPGKTQHNKPDLRQKLHHLTDDRDAEAKALADRAGTEVDEAAARDAVDRAHGELRDEKEPAVQGEHGERLATVKDAEAAVEDTR
jgi:hypothetical protein